MTDQPTQYRGLFRAEKFAPRESFSVSQISCAFGAGNETPETSDTGCQRAWGYRYLGGLKQREYTWEEACALPEDTDTLKRLKGGAKAKTWGKVAERLIERYLEDKPIDMSDPAWPFVFVGLGLLPHPTQMESFSLQEPIKVRTGDHDPITWAGFKDFVPVMPGSGRVLIDFKTTQPKVDKRYNSENGRSPTAWRYQKLPADLASDWQFNMYAHDEHVRSGTLPLARWVYFASPGTDKYPNKPQAVATDMVPGRDFDMRSVGEIVSRLDTHARTLRGHIRNFRDGTLTPETLPANTLACNAYGGCPYRSTVGGPCKAEETALVPIGAIARKTKPTASAPNGSFIFKPDGFAPYVHSEGKPMGLKEDIENAMAQRSAQTAGYPVVAASGGVTGAPVPTAGLPPVFVAPSGANPFQPGANPFQPTAPAPAPVQPPFRPALGNPPEGAPTGDPNYVHDGQGAYRFQPAAPAPLSHVGPPEGAQEPGNPFGPAPAPIQAAAPPAPSAPEPVKRKAGRPPKVQPAPTQADTVAADLTAPPEPRDTIPAPGIPTCEITVRYNGLTISCAAPFEVSDSLVSYVLGQVAN